jgi:cytochrome c biogenesis factor
MSDQPVATPAVRTRAREDLYITLMAFEESGSSITIRTLVEPLVGWIWVGAAVIGIGALIALQYRTRRAGDASPRRTGSEARSRKREEVVA